MNIVINQKFNEELMELIGKSEDNENVCLIDGTKLKVSFDDLKTLREKGDGQVHLMQYVKKYPGSDDFRVTPIKYLGTVTEYMLKEMKKGN